LLDQMGWKKGTQGAAADSSGSQLELSFTTSSSDRRAEVCCRFHLPRRESEMRNSVERIRH
jgi:hypothetical protein